MTSVSFGTGIKTPEEPESEKKDLLWGFFEQGEEFAEEYIGTGIKDFAGDDIPIIKAGSLAMLAFGIRSYRELLFGVASLAAYYYMAKDDNPSLDGAISGLSAVQIARKQYFTANIYRIVPSLQRLEARKSHDPETIGQDGNLCRCLLPRIKKSCLRQNGDRQPITARHCAIRGYCVYHLARVPRG